MILSIPSFELIEVRNRKWQLCGITGITSGTGKHCRGPSNSRMYQWNPLSWWKAIIELRFTLKLTLLEEYHSTPIGGDARLAKTSSRLGANFTWKGITKGVTEFVSTCHVCQQTKYYRRHLLDSDNLLNLYLRLGGYFKGFVVSLSAFQGNTIIMVVVDRLSKEGQFGMLPTHLQLKKRLNSSPWYVGYMGIQRVPYQTETLFSWANFGTSCLNKWNKTEGVPLIIHSNS